MLIVITLKMVFMSYKPKILNLNFFHKFRAKMSEDIFNLSNFLSARKKIGGWYIQFCPFCQEIGSMAKTSKMCDKALELHIWRKHKVQLDLSTKRDRKRVKSIWAIPLIIDKLTKERSTC